MSKAYSANAKVNEDTCIGCASCCVLEEDVFEFDEKTQKAVVRANPSDVGFEKLKSVVDACPSLSISIVDEKGNQIYPK